MDISQIVNDFFEEHDEVLEHRKPELRNRLLSKEYGYEYGVVGPRIFSKKEGNQTHLLIEANLATGEEGYTYTTILNDSQMQAFRQANDNAPITKWQKRIFVGAAIAPVAGTIYALNDLPYSGYVAGVCLLGFVAGFRIGVALMNRTQYKNAKEKFNMLNLVTDQREAITRALSNY